MVVVLLVVTFVISAMPIIVFVNELTQQGGLSFKGIMVIPFALAMIALGIWAVVMFLVNSPRIIIDETTISFLYHRTKQVYNISDIDKIAYTGKRTLQYCLGHKAEGAKIKFINGDVKYIYDDMYNNTHELKQYLQELTEGNTYTPQYTETDIDMSNVKYYKGTLLFSFRGIVSLFFLTMTLVFLYVLLDGRAKSIGDDFFMLAIFSTMFLLFSSTLYYIGISDKYLLIKNHIFLWRKIKYRLEDIKEVVLDSQTKSPNHIRVIIKDFRNKMYMAGTLSDEKWKELEQDLITKEIKVRNHLYL